MDFLHVLWLPIVLSAAAVWMLALVVWMMLPHHKQDFVGLPDEDGFMEYLRKSKIPPGNYGFPDARTRVAMQSDKVQQAWKDGPVGHLSVWKTPLTMGDKMIGTFLVYLVVSVLIAYLTRVAIPGSAGFAKVFQVAATSGMLAYCFSSIPNAIWWGSYKRTIVANVIDGVLYGLVTGAIFAWLWPR